MPNTDQADRTEYGAPAPGGNGLVPPEARREIEAVVSTFRQWLLEAEQMRGGWASVAELEPDVPPVDLHSVLAEWTALKGQLHLEARGSKAMRETMAEAAESFREGTAQVHREARDLLNPLLRERDRLREDLHDGQFAQERNWIELVLDIREGLARGAAARPGWRGWLLGRGWIERIREGYQLALRRIDTALESRNVRTIDCVGQPVDPQRMQVVDLTSDGNLPPGHVTEVIRPGYVCGNRVIRYAEVRAVVGAEEPDECGEDADLAAHDAS